MKKKQSITSLVTRVERVAPALSFAAYYNAKDPNLKASFRLYKNRAFVYILSVDYKGEEKYIYVGQTVAQYQRLLCHLGEFSFDRVYLFECQPEQLNCCEVAVINLLSPLYNRQNNPGVIQYGHILDVKYDVPQDRKSTEDYLQKLDRYNCFGLYGFHLPVAMYRALEQKAALHKRTISQELTNLLETILAEEVKGTLCEPIESYKRSNLITTGKYGQLHGRSREQIKQYLHQKGRMAGVKIGRDWVIIEDEAFPEDRRERSATH